jgi:hypothetical protein
MNTEYVWWVVVLLLVGGGAIVFLALGSVPEIEAEPDGRLQPEARLQPEHAMAQRPPLSTTVPGPDDPRSTSETP